MLRRQGADPACTDGWKVKRPSENARDSTVGKGTRGATAQEGIAICVDEVAFGRRTWRPTLGRSRRARGDGQQQADQAGRRQPSAHVTSVELLTQLVEADTTINGARERDRVGAGWLDPPIGAYLRCYAHLSRQKAPIPKKGQDTWQSFRRSPTWRSRSAISR